MSMGSDPQGALASRRNSSLNRRNSLSKLCHPAFSPSAITRICRPGQAARHSSTCSGTPPVAVQRTARMSTALTRYSMSWARSWLEPRMATAPILCRAIMLIQN